MHLNIYFGSNRLQISDNFSKLNTSDQEISEIESKTFLNNFKNDTGKSLIFYSQDVFSSLRKFSSAFKSIIACGGLVLNKNHELLMIFRRQVWDLPKGKLDNGENFETCAIREVKEETGLQNIALKNYACSCFHIYEQNLEWYLKETKWYWMESQSSNDLKPQLEENIECVEWVNRSEAVKRLTHSFRSFEEIILLLNSSVI